MSAKTLISTNLYKDKIFHVTSNLVNLSKSFISWRQQLL
eukprot:UN01611